MKKIVLLLTLLFAAGVAFCQSFMHGAGISIIVGSSPGGKTTIGEGFIYSPRFNFIETEKLSVSAGIPLTVGLSISTSSYTNSNYNDGTAAVGIMVNAPVIINLNMGRGSTKANRQKFGYFVGAGFGYHHGDFLENGYDNQGYYYEEAKSINTWGPAGNAGMRFGIGRKHRNIEVRFSYMKGLTNNISTSMSAVSCLFNF